MRIKAQKTGQQVKVVLSFKPSTYKTVERWAVVQDKRPSTAIVEFMEEAMPQLIMVAQTFEAAKKGDRVKTVENVVNASGLSLKRLGETMLKLTSK